MPRGSCNGFYSGRDLLAVWPRQYGNKIICVPSVFPVEDEGHDLLNQLCEQFVSLCRYLSVSGISPRNRDHPGLPQHIKELKLTFNAPSRPPDVRYQCTNPFTATHSDSCAVTAAIPSYRWDAPNICSGVRGIRQREKSSSWYFKPEAGSFPLNHTPVKTEVFKDVMKALMKLLVSACH